MNKTTLMLAFAATTTLTGCGLFQQPQPRSQENYQSQIFRPADFKQGQVTVTLKNLSSDESVAVIPVNALQPEAVDGFTYQLEASNVASPVPNKALVVEDQSQHLRTELDRQHHQFMQQQQNLLKKIQQKGIQPLSAQKQGLNGCPVTQVGQTCNYWVFAENDQVQVKTTLRHVSAHAYWFVDQQDAQDLTDSELAEFARVFEEKLYKVDTQYFGTPADIDGNGKIKIVFSREVGKSAFGYVYGVDWYPDAAIFEAYGVHSNEGDIFYSATPSSFLPDITRESMLSYDLPSTLVHELKHLISGGQRFVQDLADEESWIEEASAVSAEELSGYGTQMGTYARNMSARGLLSPQNVRVYLSDAQAGDESSNFYGYNFLFMWRQAELVGHNNFWRKWSVNNTNGKANLEKVTGKPFDEQMLDFAQVLMFSNSGITSTFDYKGLNLREGLKLDPNRPGSFSPLGYRPLKSLKDTARSMAYYVGRGQNKDATITLKTNFASPYLVVVRFKGELPWGPANTLAGTINVPAGKSTAGLTLTACLLDKGQCLEDSPKRTVKVFQKGEQATFSLTGLRDGTYTLEATLDANNNGQPDAGELYDCVKEGENCAQLSLSRDDLVLNVQPWSAPLK